MLDPDEAKRQENLAYVIERCALADEVGARCCVDIAGSYDPESLVRRRTQKICRANFSTPRWLIAVR